MGRELEKWKVWSDLSFLTRHRLTSVTSHAVVPGSVAADADAGRLTAVVANSRGQQLRLTIAAYEGGARIRVTELEDVGRFSLRGIVLPSAEEPRKFRSASVTEDRADVVLSFGERLTLQFDPFQLRFGDADADAGALITLNARGFFDFEHRAGVPSAAATHAETWKAWTDTKPFGPEAFSLDVTFHDFAEVYGIPEHCVRHALRPTVSLPEDGGPGGPTSNGGDAAHGSPYRLYNLDVFSYETGDPFSLYASIPFMQAHGPRRTVGVFFNNATEAYVDVARPGRPPGGLAASCEPGEASGVGEIFTQWTFEAGELDMFVLLGPRPADLLRQYAGVTGRPEMPPLWSLGYHQCRWNYDDEADVRAVNQGFRDHAVPCDVIWLDIEHTRGKRYLTWDRARFPDPGALQEELAMDGRHMVAIVDPHIASDPDWAVFRETMDGRAVRDRHGAPYHGECWPGDSVYPDWLDPGVREWWAGLLQLDAYEGSTEHLHIWNDMNEPSVFNGPEITMDKDALHLSGTEHRNVHNVSGHYFHAATVDGLLRRGRLLNPEKGVRPFVLTRAAFAGTQRLGPLWTGDTQASWDHLRHTLPMLLSLSSSGLPFVGADVGGFFGNPEPELLERWYQLGTFYPFFRGHAHEHTERREPWLFGETTLARIRGAIALRYRLLPYIYTLFWRAHVEGLPVMRPMWFECPKDLSVAHLDSQFMMGEALLVAPVMQPAADIPAGVLRVHLPREARWYNVASGSVVGAGIGEAGVGVGPDHPAMFLRGGTIVPVAESVGSTTADTRVSDLCLVVAPGPDGRASGRLYLDDGATFAFREGEYCVSEFSYDGLELRCRASRGPGSDRDGAADVHVTRVQILGLDHGTLAPGKGALLPGALVAEKAGLRLPVRSDWVLPDVSKG